MDLSSVAAQLWDQLVLILDAQEQARAGRFHFDRDRKSYVAAHALLRVMLSGQAPRPPADWQFSRNRHGKPALSPDVRSPPLTFSISHTRGLVAAALTLQHEIGIDVEAIDTSRLDLGLWSHVLTAAELQEMANHTTEERPEYLFSIWTLKEACLKAMGKGLSAPLKDLSFSLDPLAVSFSGSIEEDPSYWLLRRSQPTQEHRLAIAMRHPAPQSVEIEARSVSPRELLDA